MCNLSELSSPYDVWFVDHCVFFVGGSILTLLNEYVGFSVCPSPLANSLQFMHICVCPVETAFFPNLPLMDILVFVSLKLLCE